MAALRSPTLTLASSSPAENKVEIPQTKTFPINSIDKIMNAISSLLEKAEEERKPITEDFFLEMKRIIAFNKEFMWNDNGHKHIKTRHLWAIEPVLSGFSHTLGAILQQEGLTEELLQALIKSRRVFFKKLRDYLEKHLTGKEPLGEMGTSMIKIFGDPEKFLWSSDPIDYDLSTSDGLNILCKNIIDNIAQVLDQPDFSIKPFCEYNPTTECWHLRLNTKNDLWPQYIPLSTRLISIIISIPEPSLQLQIANEMIFWLSNHNLLPELLVSLMLDLPTLLKRYQHHISHSEDIVAVFNLLKEHADYAVVLSFCERHLEGLSSAFLAWPLFSYLCEKNLLGIKTKIADAVALGGGGLFDFETALFLQDWLDKGKNSQFEKMAKTFNFDGFLDRITSIPRDLMRKKTFTTVAPKVRKILCPELKCIYMAFLLVSGRGFLQPGEQLITGLSFVEPCSDSSEWGITKLVVRPDTSLLLRCLEQGSRQIILEFLLTSLLLLKKWPEPQNISCEFNFSTFDSLPIEERQSLFNFLAKKVAEPQDGDGLSQEAWSILKSFQAQADYPIIKAAHTTNVSEFAIRATQASRLFWFLESCHIEDRIRICKEQANLFCSWELLAAIVHKAPADVNPIRRSQREDLIDAIWTACMSIPLDAYNHGYFEFVGNIVEPGNLPTLDARGDHVGTVLRHLTVQQQLAFVDQVQLDLLTNRAFGWASVYFIINNLHDLPCVKFVAAFISPNLTTFPPHVAECCLERLKKIRGAEDAKSIDEAIEAIKIVERNFLSALPREVAHALPQTLLQLCGEYAGVMFLPAPKPTSADSKRLPDSESSSTSSPKR